MNYLHIILFFVLIVGCRSTSPLITNDENNKEEFRAVWVASVEHIDWPHAADSTVEQHIDRYKKILQFYKDLNFNVVFVQLRTAGDALYSSEHAPASRWLSGTEGIGYEKDLLKDIIALTHAEHMEFHAWLNPYRATTSLDTSLLSSDHVFYTHPEWIIRYGSKYYLNPGSDAVQIHLLDVISELISNYDIDGVHFDDYFYPYKIQGELFNDTLDYTNSPESFETIDDWRRDNVSTFIRSCHQMIKAHDSSMDFSISPFGVWRNIADDPSGSDTRAGQTLYDDLYADTRFWLKEGWLDVIVPQLYWSMDYPPASHKKLVSWWSDEAGDVPLVIGLGAYKAENNHDSAWFDIQELNRQIAYGRNQNVDGFCLFSAKSLMQKKHIRDVLFNTSFSEKAYSQRQQRWKSNLPPFSIQHRKGIDGYEIICSEIPEETDRIRVISLRKKGPFKRKIWKTQDYETTDDKLIIKKVEQAEQWFIQAVNRSGVSSKIVELEEYKTDL